MTNTQKKFIYAEKIESDSSFYAQKRKAQLTAYTHGRSLIGLISSCRRLISSQGGCSVELLAGEHFMEEYNIELILHDQVEMGFLTYYEEGTFTINS